MKAVLGVALIVAACAFAQAPVSCVGPISLDDVTGLLKDEVPPRRVQLFVTTCGVTFEFTPEAEKRIRAAGGTDAVIAAVREKAKPSGPKPRATRVNDIDGQTYIWISPGRFTMGCSDASECPVADEKPAHEVEISKGFWLGTTEVTVGAWKRFVRAKGKQMPTAPSFNSAWSDDRQPVVNISWTDSDEFCRWVGGRLPSEAEWEYAGRAGSKWAYYGEPDRIAWHSKNSGGKANRVATKQTNAWGLHDMQGNVWEWVNDWYDAAYYQSRTARDPKGPGSGSLRTLRGGAWMELPGTLRVSNRLRYEPGIGNDFSGCRCAWD